MSLLNVQKYVLLFLTLAISATTVKKPPQYNLNAEYWPWQSTNSKIASINPSPQEIASLFSSKKNFLWGVATSAHQVEGDCTNNNWSQHECIPGAIITGEKSGRACDHWNRIDEDIELMQNLGVNAYRFSIEWSKIEPEEGVFNEAAMSHYQDVCDKLNNAGIKPVITLHHYTHPLWFEHKLAFEKEENIPLFVEFCAKIFERLHTKVHLWITFNSPSGYALQGYYRGVYPPAKKNMNLAMTVTRNMLAAHVQLYTRLKKIDAHAKIGILHHHYPLKMYSWKSPWDKIGCMIGNTMTNTATLNFFKTGTFSVYVPYKVHIKYHNPLAPKTIDFLGLSYYSHAHLKNFKAAHPESEELHTDKEAFVIYPEGLYHSIKEVTSYIGSTIPIYIAENGIADALDNRRELFLKRYLYALGQACQEFNVQGYIYWSLMDNFEWHEGYSKRFGLYEVDFTTFNRKKRKSADFYSSVIHTYYDTCSANF